MTQRFAKKKPAESRRAGFTLIEIMLACVLATLLTVAVFQVMRSTFEENRRMEAHRQPMSEAWLLREQIESDLRNARAYRVQPNRLELAGFLTRDLATGVNTQLLSYVVYETIPQSQRLTLVRTERVLNSTQSSPQVDTLWHGVGRMVAFPKGEYIDGRQSSVPELATLGLRVLTGGIRFSLSDDQGKLLVEVL